MANRESQPQAHHHGAYRSRIAQIAGILEALLAVLVMAGLVFCVVPLVQWMPGLLTEGNEVDIRTFLERALDVVIAIEFIKMLAMHSPGTSLEVLLYAITRHLIVGHESAAENLLSVLAIALIFLIRKYLFIPSFNAASQETPDTQPEKQPTLSEK